MIAGLTTLIARINDSGIYLHDMINIKKEDSKPFESWDRTVEDHLSLKGIVEVIRVFVKEEVL